MTKKNILIALATYLLAIPVLLYAQKDSLDTKELIIRTMKEFQNNNKLLNIKLDTRYDYSLKTENGNLEQNSFRQGALKVLVSGEIIPSVRYSLRQRLNKAQTVQRDNNSLATDWAYMEFDANKFTFRVGKQIVLYGSIENDYNPTDLYSTTMCYDELIAYASGINIAYHLKKQTLNLQVTNVDESQFTDQKYANKAYAIILLWEGNLFNGLFKTRYSYGAFQHDKNTFYNWWIFGNQIIIDDLSIELDGYFGEKLMDYSASVNINDLGQREVHDKSIDVNVKYKFNKFVPQIKCIWDERKDKVMNASYTNRVIQGGVEYYPFGGPLKNLRFHSIYSFTNTSFHGKYKYLTDKNQNSVIIGGRWLFRVM